MIQRCARWLLLLMVTVTLCLDVHADPVMPTHEVGPFLRKYCADCHAEGASEGDFELRRLSSELTADAQFEAWKLVYDRIERGEMPPEDAEIPGEREKNDLLEMMAAALTAADRMRRETNGRVTARRLNAIQFETVMSDLLKTPLDIADLLPEDAKAEGFSTVGSALNISSVQMAAYLEAIDASIDQAVRFTERPSTQKFRLSLLNNHGYMENYRLQHPTLPVINGMNLYATEAMSNHHALWGHYVVPHTGKYRIKVSAYTLNTEDPIALTLRVGGNGHKESLRVKHRLLDHLEIDSDQPKVYDWEGELLRGHFLHLYPSELPIYRFPKNKRYGQLRWSGPGVCVQWLEIEGPITETWPPPGQERLFGGVHLEPINGASNPDPNVQLYSDPIIPADPRERPADWPPGGNRWKLLAGPVDNNVKFPAQDYSRRRGRVVRQILAGKHKAAEPLPDYESEPYNLKPGNPLPSYGGEPIYRNVPHPGDLVRTLRLSPDDAKADADRLIRRMLLLAFRRPVEDEEADRYVRFVHDWLDRGVSFESAMRTGYKAIFTSPHFLFHQSSLSDEATSKQSLADTKRDRSSKALIHDFALAERLAFFLWCSTPDEELLRLAKEERLSQPEVLRKQTERLLADQRSQRFVKDFLGQWLDLHQIDFTSPDTQLYPEYDAVLRTSMLEEPICFFSTLIEQNRSVANLIDSDFITINRRLAQHYGMEGVTGRKLSVVEIDDESVRGGVMTQAAVLKVTANGSNTSPVVRGVWVNERVLGKPTSPPPPGIPAVEPDIRGAKTIREQLEKHRSSSDCASCHAKIDPPGVALESFDPIGRLRTNYRILDPSKSDLRKQDHTLRYNIGLPVDPSYSLADGQPFSDIRELKRIYAANRQQIAETFAERLLVYATGATTSFADRTEIERIADQTRAEDYGVRSLIHAVIQSDLFRTR